MDCKPQMYATSPVPGCLDGMEMISHLQNLYNDSQTHVVKDIEMRGLVKGWKVV